MSPSRETQLAGPQISPASGAKHPALLARLATTTEMAPLQRFVPAYAPTVHQWLSKRLRGLASPAGSSSAF